jgi:hypothetical protein
MHGFEYESYKWFIKNRPWGKVDVKYILDNRQDVLEAKQDVK